MPTTPTYALPYQGLTDPPNGATLGELLAKAVETELSRVDSAASAVSGRVTTLENKPAQLIGSTIKSSADQVLAAGTAAIVVSKTFTAVANETYVVTVTGVISGTNTGSTAIFTARHAAGATVSTTDAQANVTQQFFVDVAGFHVPFFLVAEFVASVSGTYTVGFMTHFFSGVGNMTLYSNSNSMLRIGVTRGIPT